MFLAITRFVIETYIVRVVRSNYKTLHKTLDLPSESFCEHESGASDNGDQVYVLAKVLTMRDHIVFLFAIYHF